MRSCNVSLKLQSASFSIYRRGYNNLREDGPERCLYAARWLFFRLAGRSWHLRPTTHRERKDQINPKGRHRERFLLFLWQLCCPPIKEDAGGKMMLQLPFVFYPPSFLLYGKLFFSISYKSYRNHKKYESLSLLTFFSNINPDCLRLKFYV